MVDSQVDKINENSLKLGLYYKTFYSGKNTSNTTISTHFQY
jgi:hypothetical protein